MHPLTIGIFGATPDTPNMGVSALFFSLIDSLQSNLSECSSRNVNFVVFDNQLGVREKSLKLGSRTFKCTFVGARGGKRFWRSENLWTMFFLSHFGRIGLIFNNVLRLLSQCDAVIDVSGGDSFSDIYGSKRFNNVLLPKRISIKLKKTLIFAPKTYGPFYSPKVRQQATDVIKKASMVWARDEESYTLVKTVLGDKFNSEIHRCGVDMAFKLPLQPAMEALDSRTISWIEQSSQQPMIGFNISGLIYHDPQAAKSRYGFKADYNQTVLAFIKKVLAETDYRILLVPHVMDLGGHYESDALACDQVISQLEDQYTSRIAVTPTQLNQSQVKWVISNMQWFCGTRMHATIAALSTATPAASISYSDKTRGVFATCGQAHHVFDPRDLNENDIVQGLMQSLLQFQSTKIDLQNKLKPVMEQANAQMKQISNFVLNC